MHSQLEGTVSFRFEKEPVSRESRKRPGVRREQTKAGGTEEDRLPLYLWLFSVPLYPNRASEPGIRQRERGNGGVALKSSVPSA
jgi:hypothetical protein